MFGFSRGIGGAGLWASGSTVTLAAKTTAQESGIGLTAGHGHGPRGRRRGIFEIEHRGVGWIGLDWIGCSPPFRGDWIGLDAVPHSGGIFEITTWRLFGRLPGPLRNGK